jgi:hypothetical protein
VSRDRDERRRLERFALLRRVERDRAALSLERRLEGLALARDAHAEAQRALAAERARAPFQPSALRSDELLAVITRRDEAREHRRELERTLAEAAAALERARAERERAGRALAEAESRLSATLERLAEAARRRGVAREERAVEEALEGLRKKPPSP